KGGECLAAARRRRHEDVAACRHFLPAPLLDRCWFGERRAKPVANGRREEIESIENLPHITQFDDFRDYKQVFLTGLIQTSDECIRASDSRPSRSALDPDRAGDGRRATLCRVAGDLLATEVRMRALYNARWHEFFVIRVGVPVALAWCLFVVVSL